MTLSNGSAASTQALLDRSSLGHLVDGVMSVDEVQLWKPRPEPYLRACATAGIAATQVGLVAVHAWDIQGARAAGLITGWCARLEHVYSPLFPAPDIQGDTLIDVVQRLAALDP